MPLTRLSVPATLSARKTRILLDATHDALVETCNVPPKDRFQLVTRFDADAMIIDPTFPDLSRTPEAVIIEILFLDGRTLSQKAALFQQIAKTAMKAGFAGDDIMITLTENAATDWSLGYGRNYGASHEPAAGSSAD